MGKLPLIIGVAALILIIYLIRKKQLEHIRFIFDYPENAKTLYTAKSNLLQPAFNEGISWTLSFWIYVDDWNYQYLKPKRIIRWPGNLYVWMSKKRNDINIQIPIEHERGIRYEYMRFKSVPIQKWIHCCIVLENRFADLWMNGKLYHSKKLSRVPHYDFNSNLLITPWKGFSGYVSRFIYYNIPIKKSEIMYRYKDGPINTSHFARLFRKFKKLAGSIKFKVDVDVDVE